jgi:hypothetical protein
VIIVDVLGVSRMQVPIGCKWIERHFRYFFIFTSLLDFSYFST